MSLPLAPRSSQPTVVLLAEPMEASPQEALPLVVTTTSLVALEVKVASLLPTTLVVVVAVLDVAPAVHRSPLPLVKTPNQPPAQVVVAVVPQALRELVVVAVAVVG